MNKYRVFRSFGNVDRDIRKHELVAVEYGMDIYAATDALMKAVNDDATETEKYRNHYKAVIYTPESVESHRRVKRYAYIITAVLCPKHKAKGDIIEYGVTEEPCAQ